MWSVVSIATRTGTPQRRNGVKLLIEILISIFLHPLAWILVLIDLMRRTDMDVTKKVIWALVSVLWGIGPILYVLVGDGRFW